MLAKKVRTEYMKKFKDPKWETFSKCYEDSLRYRLTRRVMEHSHKPWFWEGWDSGSDSSGWSTPKLTRNKVAPLPLPPPPPASSSEVKQRLLDLKPKVRPEEEEEGTGGAPPVEDLQTGGEEASIVVNGVNGAGEALGTAAPATSGPSDGSATDNGPADSASSDGEPRNPAPRRRHRCRVSRSEPAQQAGSHDDKTAGLKKPRAKSQPPFSTKESRRASSRLDWTERMTESHTFDACTQTRREADKRPPDLDRRRARSADLEKRRRKQLVAAAEDRWTTEYMRCFSARVR
ncbi:centriole, cilia and spindle-associated protein isoform X1 [Oryzias latipes]|uniref:centriole, cilia and spindle-associated protein isoform X1 n=1 Tax=Oryzias latipes TaxID=8090 RepID=UPI0002A4C93E|nr:centriole, cilia and spindle-associated protein isoform X1 [Oryzias latipes]XP_020562372.1 centriole, cilia and spindle-associated protein isoform X1 [Oryzias latipes]